MTTAPLTLDEARALFAGEVDASWLSELMSTQDGRALLDAALDMVVEADRRDVLAADSLSAVTATRGSRAVANLLVRRTRTGPRLRMPGGTFVESSDGVRFVVDDDVFLAEGDTATAFDTTCTAEFPGDVGVFPTGTVDRFAPFFETLSGAGTKIEVVADGPNRRVKLTTDVAQPHPFRGTMRGLYVTIVDDDGSHAANVGRIVQVDAVNAGGAPGDVGGAEDAVAWSKPFGPTEPEVVGWATGTYAFTWRVVPWEELGLVVTNSSAASLGTPPALEGMMLLRGLPFGAGDAADVLRRRLRLAPQRPTPLGLLRKVLQAAVELGQDITKFRIYEPGAEAPDSTVDRYAAQFPAWGGFLADVHCSDMDTPETPDIFVTQAPYGVSAPGAKNPGLGLPFDGRERRVIVRWDEGVLSDATARPIRALIFAAGQKARPPGTAVMLYRVEQWGYPP